MPTKEELRFGNFKSHHSTVSSHFLVIDVFNIWSYTLDLLTLYGFMDHLLYTPSSKSCDVLNAGILQPLVLSTYIITSSRSYRIVYGMLESYSL